MSSGEAEEQVSARQVVTAKSGFAYGAVGADIHIFGDGTPVYLLENRRAAPRPSPQWLRELPSRMLNARFQVVDFTGRHDDLEQLRQWRDEGPRLSVRWLHAPGGQGKTRLADRFAVDSAEHGWKAVTALHGPGTVWPPPGSQDLSLDDAAGVLIIVDYADQWPLSHLTWLFSNALLHQTHVPARVLLLARAADAWPRVRATLTNLQAATSSQHLPPLSDEAGGRAEMFTAARDTFANLYRLHDPTGIEHPSLLSSEMGLTLAVHMAALVAVDAHVAGQAAPPTLEGLTIYLLDREHLHWARLYGDESHELLPRRRRYRTPPHIMNRAVFTAVLTGAVPRPAAVDVLELLHIAPDPEQIIADHSICYPSTDQDVFFEPLYPDRLAEDFLALTLIGHSADYPAQPWASGTLRKVLNQEGEPGSAPEWASRSVTFLANSAGPGRWPHVTEHLNELLTTNPTLALAAGSAALTALAEVANPDFDVLEAVVAQFPVGRHPDLDAGMAAVTSRVTTHLLSHTDSPFERAYLKNHLAVRQGNAGMYREALESARYAEAIWRSLALESPAEYKGAWADSLASLSNCLGDAGHHGEALTATEETLGLYRQLSKMNPVEYEPRIAITMGNLGVRLSAVGRRDEALEAAEQAIQLCRRAGGQKATIASMLDNLGVKLWAVERRDEALNATQEAVELYRGLAQANPTEYEPELARCLNNLGIRLCGLSRLDEARRSAEEAVRIYQRLTRANSAKYEPDLAGSLGNLAVYLSLGWEHAEALTIAEQAVASYRQLAEANPALHEPRLADSLGSLGVKLSALGQYEEAVAVVQESVNLRRRLTSVNASLHEPELARALSNLGLRLRAVGRYAEARAAALESVQICRRLARISPTVYEPHLAGSLMAFAATRESVDDEMERIYAEVVQLYRRLAAAAPKAFDGNLQTALSAHASVLDILGRTKKANKIRRELGTGQNRASALGVRVLRWAKSRKPL
ncbi:DUF3856 domain-containing protein [Streptomyces sp. NPDC008159]|uniref:DUF3856 domain-containing protein n=1 Tax=Streptomyces sp. NPDC008159 TaxID=3364817 RepID=UPI0036E635C0